MIITVELNPIEIAVCNMMGNMRSFACRLANSKPGVTVQSAKDKGRDGILNDEEGFIGEYAFCKYWNIFPDITAIPRKGSPDCKLKGKMFDVKATTYKNGRLQVKGFNKDVEVFALAIVDGTTVTFPGYIYAKNLYKDENLVDKGFEEPTYAVTQDKLLQWEDNG